MTHSIQIGKSNLSNNRHIKNILHVPTSAAVMKTARQTAILHLYNMP